MVGWVKCQGEGCGSAVHIALLVGVSVVAMAHLNKKFVQIFGRKFSTSYLTVLSFVKIL
jgi:hypothetical protein